MKSLGFHYLKTVWQSTFQRIRLSGSHHLKFLLTNIISADENIAVCLSRWESTYEKLGAIRDENIAHKNIVEQILWNKYCKKCCRKYCWNRFPQWPTDEKLVAIREKRPIHGEEKIPLSWPNQSEITAENLKRIHFEPLDILQKP